LIGVTKNTRNMNNNNTHLTTDLKGQHLRKLCCLNKSRDTINNPLIKGHSSIIARIHTHSAELLLFIVEFIMCLTSSNNIKRNKLLYHHTHSALLKSVCFIVVKTTLSYTHCLWDSIPFLYIKKVFNILTSAQMNLNNSLLF
jgi:hypothetical protein